MHAKGSNGPDYKQSLFMPNGVEVPCGRLIQYPKPPVPPTQPGVFGGNMTLNHNEFIVYNSKQVRVRYMLQIVKKTKKEMSKH